MGASSQRHQKLSSNGIVNEQYACLPVFGTSNNDVDKCCMSYRLQSHCIDNRHLHAWIQKYGRATCLHIVDLTHKKASKTLIQGDYELDFLPSKVVSNSSLQMCNVVGFYKDLVVTQIFCQSAVKFVIIGINDSECKLIFNKPYLQQQKLQLYECYISPDENYMLLRQNSIYATSYANEIENIEGVITVKLNWLLRVGEQISCENLNNHVLPANHKYALSFDTRTDNDIAIFTYIAGSDRCNVSLYKIKKDLVLFHIALFISEFEALPGKFQNLQFFRDGTALLLSVLGNTFHRVGSLSMGPAICRDKFVTVYWLDPSTYDKLGSFKYISFKSVEHFTPMISPSGQYCFCGGKLHHVHTFKPISNEVKSLKQMCMHLLADTVLTEDLFKLPLPKTIIKNLERGHY